MENNLPEGWIRCKFGDVAAIQNGFAFPSKDFRNDKGIPLIKQSQLSGDKVNLDNCVFLNEKYLVTKKDFILKKGDVLIGMSGSIGKLCLYDLDIPALQNQRTGKVIPVNELLLNKKLLWYYLSALGQILIQKGKGLGVTNVSANDIEDLPFSLPPFAEQLRIVYILDSLMQRIDQNKIRLEKIPMLLKRFRQSVLAAAVSGRLTEDWRDSMDDDKRWQEIQLNDIIPNGGIFDGPFGSNLKTKDYVIDGVRVIRLENVGHLKFVSEKETFITEEKYQQLKRHTVKQGDIIFSSFISDEIRACILPILSTKAIAKADCFCVRPDENLVNKNFLLYSLVSDDSFEQLVTNIHGATRPRINTSQLRSLSIHLPDLDEQQEIVRRVEQLFSLANKIESRFNRAKAVIDKLPQSILAKAFRGELVPQDSNDEPAGELLKRIREEKKKANEVRKGVKKLKIGGK